MGRKHGLQTVYAELPPFAAFSQVVNLNALAVDVSRAFCGLVKISQYGNHVIPAIRVLRQIKLQVISTN
jgi:hypothetical protein